MLNPLFYRNHYKMCHASDMRQKLIIIVLFALITMSINKWYLIHDKVDMRMACVDVHRVDNLILRRIKRNDALRIFIGHLGCDDLGFGKTELRMPYSFSTVFPKASCGLLHFCSCGLDTWNITPSDKHRLLRIRNILNTVLVGIGIKKMCFASAEHLVSRHNI